jgi:hypothetical protein
VLPWVERLMAADIDAPPEPGIVKVWSDGLIADVT